MNAGLRQAIEAEPFNADELTRLLESAVEDKIQLDTQLLGYVASQTIKHAMVRLEHAFDENLPFSISFVFEH